MAWDRPILTDSGGFQVFSLGDRRTVDDDGVTFRSHLDGSMHRFTPESVIAREEALGADIIMPLDECVALPSDDATTRRALDRTHRWLERAVRAKRRDDQALFAIVQGGLDPALRREGARFAAALDVPGIAIGGLSVGESKAEMDETLALTTEALAGRSPPLPDGRRGRRKTSGRAWRGASIFSTASCPRASHVMAGCTRPPVA